MREHGNERGTEKERCGAYAEGPCGQEAIEKARLEGIEEGKNGKKKTPEMERIEQLEKQLAAVELNFETAAILRDQLVELKKNLNDIEK